MRRDLYNLEGACHSIGAIAFLVTLRSRNISIFFDTQVYVQPNLLSGL
jgi:hypothetical protein